MAKDLYEEYLKAGVMPGNLEKPPLLTREQIDKMWDISIPEGSLTVEQVAEELMVRILQVAQAQWEVDIKFYEVESNK